MLRRRDFVCALGVGASMAALPGIATAHAAQPRASLMVVATGLVSDAAFEQGVGAGQRHLFQAKGGDYADLLATLVRQRGERLAALIRPASAILLEQALRDSGGRLTGRMVLQAPAEDQTLARWAFQIGGQLARLGAVDQRFSFTGQPLVALSATL